MKRAFLIHGWGGSPYEGWLPWLKTELEQQLFSVIVPAMPNSRYPQQKEWISYLKQQVQKTTENDYFVGHSLGVITILRYLETLQEHQKIGGAVFIAGFSDTTIGSLQTISEIQNFFSTPVDIKKIKLHCNKFIAIHSDDDPYVDLSYGTIFKQKLDAKLIIEHNKKHFSGDDGITGLPVALKAIETLTQHE